MDTIFMKRMPFYARHGVFVEERHLGQRFVVSLDMTLDLQPAGQTDDLELTVNYGDVYTKVQEVMQGSPCRLLETVAQRIADVLLQTYPALHSVLVQVEKPGAPIAGIFDTVGVTITRMRAT
ncbi:MAG: dihydroneopterin aldolase [Firmicutes bacterium]|nr:dihydroneopterin aldolase [Bacillota bacterium]